MEKLSKSVGMIFIIIIKNSLLCILLLSSCSKTIYVQSNRIFEPTEVEGIKYQHQKIEFKTKLKKDKDILANIQIQAREKGFFNAHNVSYTIEINTFGKNKVKAWFVGSKFIKNDN